MLMTTTLPVIKVYFNFVVSTKFVVLSSFIPIIPLVYIGFYVSNYNLCLL